MYLKIDDDSDSMDTFKSQRYTMCSDKTMLLWINGMHKALKHLRNN